ncbi:putative transcription factor [Vitis vinifera]|uniref:Putative transcription factor n=1 Tax=Vitis vinifera TaxID=29760 RepID=A0A438CW52_VITVI|nr:putative transcription factor [Vitis vinifera]
MASAEDPTTVFGEEDLDDDEDEDSEEEEENLACPPTKTTTFWMKMMRMTKTTTFWTRPPLHLPPLVILISPLPPSLLLLQFRWSPSPSPAYPTASPSLPLWTLLPIRSGLVPGEEKKPFDESRRLFQRLWTDEDEIELLQGFLEYSAQRGPNSSSHHHDTTAFYDQIKSKLQLDFNKNQLVEKLRRLKKKYRNVVSRISSAHHGHHRVSQKKPCSKTMTQTLTLTPPPTLVPIQSHPKGFNSYSIDVNSAEKKVPRSRKRSRAKLDEKPVLNNQNHEMPSSIPSLIEETVRSCLSPLFKELLHNAVNGPSCGARGFGGMALNPMPLSFGGTEVTDERWRKQQIWSWRCTQSDWSWCKNRLDQHYRS